MQDKNITPPFSPNKWLLVTLPRSHSTFSCTIRTKIVSLYPPPPKSSHQGCPKPHIFQFVSWPLGCTVSPTPPPPKKSGALSVRPYAFCMRFCVRLLHLWAFECAGDSRAVGLGEDHDAVALDLLVHKFRGAHRPASVRTMRSFVRTDRCNDFFFFFYYWFGSSLSLPCDHGWIRSASVNVR